MNALKTIAERVRKFRPTFGTAAFALAMFAIAIACIGLLVIISLGESLQKDVAGAATAKWKGPATALSVIVATFAWSVAAVVLGLLSLFGLGKRNGTSRPVLGSLGFLLGGMVAAACVAIPVVGIALNNAEKKAEKAALKAAIMQQQSVRPLVNRECHLQLSLPGLDWNLIRDESAQQFSPNAVFGARRLTGVEGRSLVAMILAEDVDSDPSEQSELKTLVERIIDNSQLDETKIEYFEPIMFQGQPAIEYRLSGSTPATGPMRVCNMVFVWRGKLLQLWCAGDMDKIDAEGHAVRPFFDAVKLLDDADPHGEQKVDVDQSDER